MPASVIGEWGVGEGHAVELSLSATERIPRPRRAPGDADDDANDDSEERGRGERPDPDAPKPPVDLSVQVEDAAGRTASVPLSDYGPIRRPLEIHILRRTDQETRDPTEMVLQSYHIPLSDFAALDASLDLTSLRAVRLVFDRAAAGEVLVDAIGFSAMGDDYWSARVR